MNQYRLHPRNRTCKTDCTYLPALSLYGHAPVPFGFPRQVRPCPKGHGSQPFRPVDGISRAPQRRTALFRPPPSEPDVPVSVASGSPISRVFLGRRYASHVPSQGLAVLSTALGHVPAYFFTGADYYDGSVALRLATFRRSRLCPRETCSVFRLPVRFLPPFITGYSSQRAFHGIVSTVVM